jgi:RNA polymerase sigma-70 factor (ECF subfamily)
MPDSTLLMSGNDERQARFEALFRRNVQSVRAYAMRRDTQRAEDVVAETFTTAWRRLEEVPEHELPWLLAVARRVLANQRRSAKRQSSLRERLALERTTTGEDVEDDPRAGRAVAALRTLSERDREVLLLIERDCLSRQAAATVLGCTRAEVRLRLHRARRRYQTAYLAAAESPALCDQAILPGGSRHAC